MLRVTSFAILFVFLWFPPVSAQEPTCWTCKDRRCDEAETLGFTDCTSRQDCGAEGCIEFCIAGPNKCAEPLPSDPIELQQLGASHCQPAPPPPTEAAPASCLTRNGAALGACLVLGSA